ncbi:TPA: 4'-phosphopantetheinyl transferase family protein [Klebsiella aerogenes]|uniref:4'-phosphopantetheinyl transferase family protein n=1 Tax=Klebsiella TaxID=570 RepID=UPI001BD03694|nr:MULTISPECIES: 4'-phosphopantetheinyl transferase superfamily protein [Klebsiella]MDU9363869.1 4'-phosphopantetheinyl transferase superfamily protein [Klebsiella sp. 141203]HEP0585747.1 4'-phosphopantetheinyl transferase superfamily protein [Klebsiella aerogenes]
MFIVTDTFHDQPFIQHAECGYLRADPALKFCRVRFARSQLQDALFSQYAIPLPPSLTGAVAKRKAEYLAGRYCAHYLLRQSGCLEPVLIAADRAPIWPAGWRGSVSHSEDIAIAVVSAEDDGLHPGVDIEHLQPEIMLESADMFVSRTEQAQLSCCGLDKEWALLLAFSAKESLFKALYPRVQQMFDFDAAAMVALDPANQRFTLRLNKTLSDAFPAGSQFSGEYYFSEGTVLTCLR